MAISSSLSSVNARLFAFAKQLKGRGHQVLIAGPDELEQVCLCCRAVRDDTMPLHTGSNTHACPLLYGTGRSNAQLPAYGVPLLRRSQDNLAVALC